MLNESIDNRRHVNNSTLQKYGGTGEIGGTTSNDEENDVEINNTNVLHVVNSGRNNSNANNNINVTGLGNIN